MGIFLNLAISNENCGLLIGKNNHISADIDYTLPS